MYKWDKRRLLIDGNSVLTPAPDRPVMHVGGDDQDMLMVVLETMLAILARLLIIKDSCSIVNGNMPNFMIPFYNQHHFRPSGSMLWVKPPLGVLPRGQNDKIPAGGRPVALRSKGWTISHNHDVGFGTFKLFYAENSTFCCTFFCHF